MIVEVIDSREIIIFDDDRMNGETRRSSTAPSMSGRPDRETSLSRALDTPDFSKARDNGESSGSARA